MNPWKMQIFKFSFFVILLFVGTISAAPKDSSEEKKIHDAVVMTSDFLTKARFKTGDYDLRNCFHKDANTYGVGSEKRIGDVSNCLTIDSEIKSLIV